MTIENKKISFIVDNPSWITNYVLKFCKEINQGTNQAIFFSSYDEVQQGDIAFYLGYKKKPQKI